MHTRLQRTLLEMAVRLVGGSAEEVDAAVAWSLEALGRQLGAAAALVVRIDDERRAMADGREWALPGAGVLALLQTVAPSAFASTFGHLARGRHVALRRARDIPEEPGAEGDWARIHGFRPLLAVPVSTSDGIGGTLAFVGQAGEEHDWPEEAVQSLKLGGSLVLGALARATAERALQASEESYRALFANARDAIFAADSATGYIIYGNRSAEALVGRSVAELRGMHQAALHPPDEAELARRVFAAHAAGDVRGLAELHVLHASGRRVPVEIAGEGHVVIGGCEAVIGVFRDLTESRRAEASERRFRALVDSVPDFIFTYDLEGRLTSANRSLLASLGRPEADVLGRTLGELGAPPDRVALAGAHRQRAAAGEDTSYELTVPHPAGERSYLVRLTPIRDLQGTVTGIAGVTSDVTARARMEAERRRLDAQILRTQKLESLEVLAGGVAHDFNNLLAAILGNIDLALTELSPLSPARVELRAAEAAAHRAAELTKQMLAYSGRGRFRLQRVDLRALLQEIDHLLRVRLPPRTALHVAIGEDACPVEADPAQLRQLVVNLVTNAVEAVGDGGGMVTLSTGTMACDEAYLRDCWVDEHRPPGRFAYVEVSDTGCGMDADTRARIFDPFFSTKFTGRGLGLPAVLGIVRGHKGTIRVTSSPGRGATFRALLPCAAPAVAERSAAPSLVEVAAEGAALVVDDDPDVRAVAGRMLARLGFAVRAADSGRAALDVLAAEPGAFRVVLLDLSMPTMDGDRVLGELRRLCPQLAVIVASGHGEEQVLSRFPPGEIAAFLPKPFELAKVTESVRAALAWRSPR